MMPDAMPEKDAQYSELQVQALIRRGQWTKALKLIDAWLVSEPERQELLLRKAGIHREQGNLEEALKLVRLYRSRRKTSNEAGLREVELLLLLGRYLEAAIVFDQLPSSLRESVTGAYYRGRILLARGQKEIGLAALWSAYLSDPSFHRALLTWTEAALRLWGKRRVRRRLDALLARHDDNASVIWGVGLAKVQLEAKHKTLALRETLARTASQASADVFGEFGGPSPQNADPESLTSSILSCLMAGRPFDALQYYHAAQRAAAHISTSFTSLIADALIDEGVHLDLARSMLEKAMTNHAQDAMLHQSYTALLLKLELGEEALSSANCTLALAGDAERVTALISRAGAHALLHRWDAAISDVIAAIALSPEARDLALNEKSLRALHGDTRFRILLQFAPARRQPIWRRFRQMLFRRHS